MRHLFLLLFLGLAASGCGGASGIEPGVPANPGPPPNFDPGGDVAPDMTGSGNASNTVP